MKCNYCGSIISKGKNIPMLAQCEVIANYCSKDCRSKAASQMIGSLEKSGREEQSPEKKAMTYFDAVGIEQELIVAMQYCDAFHKTRAEALKEAAEKYTNEQYAEALLIIKAHYRKAYADTKELFAYAVSSKNWDAEKLKEEKKNGTA